MNLIKKLFTYLNIKINQKKLDKRAYSLSIKHSYEQRLKSLIKYINKYEKLYSSR